METELSAGHAGLRDVPAGGFDGPRACGPFDLAPTLDLINLVFRTHGVAAADRPRFPTMGWDYAHVYHPDNLDNVRIVSHQGRVVCSVAIYPTTVRTPHGTLSVGGINAVGTHPDFRRYGLATATLVDAHAKMRANGHHIGLLSTGIHNWYRKYGWERAGQQRTFTLDRRNVVFLPEAPGWTSPKRGGRTCRRCVRCTTPRRWGRRGRRTPSPVWPNGRRAASLSLAGTAGPWPMPRSVARPSASMPAHHRRSRRCCAPR
ncbi:MAG: GNAT family N-acetyltransferase [Chloroflexi bacterium]|nr:GNAT family N-acetyltransferase [Chloroflexota bacterium]